MFVLDANVLSVLRKIGDNRADDLVTAWISIQDASILFLCVLTVMKFEIGILRVARRDSGQGHCYANGWTNMYSRNSPVVFFQLTR